MVFLLDFLLLHFRYGGTYSLCSKYFIMLLSTSGQFVQKFFNAKKGSYKPLRSITALTLYS